MTQVEVNEHGTCNKKGYEICVFDEANNGMGA